MNVSQVWLKLQISAQLSQVVNTTPLTNQSSRSVARQSSLTQGRQEGSTVSNALKLRTSSRLDKLLSKISSEESQPAYSRNKKSSPLQSRPLREIRSQVLEHTKYQKDLIKCFHPHPVRENDELIILQRNNYYINKNGCL